MVDRDLLYVGQLCVGKMYISFFFVHIRKRYIAQNISIYTNKCVLGEVKKKRALF